MSNYPRNKWKNQFQIIDSSSNFHLKLRNIFIEDTFFSQLRCYQEVPVVDLIPEYPNPNHRYDWFIEDLNYIIELNGKQHYKLTNYGGISYAQSLRALRLYQARDIQKRDAAIQASFNYLIISYLDEKKLLNPVYLKKLILEQNE